MVISYTGLVDLVSDGVLRNVKYENINGSSIDIRLGGKLLVETPPPIKCPHCLKPYRGAPMLQAIQEAGKRSELFYCMDCGTGHQAHEWIGCVDPSEKEPINMIEADCSDGYILWPGSVVLAQSMEEFNLPLHITAEYRLKSSMARIFLEHLHAGWCDPGWHGSVLTLELVNMNNYHPIKLTKGMKIGQVMFYEHEPVPEDRSYKFRGQYNNSREVTHSRGIK